jgi:hypothetical protein
MPVGQTAQRTCADVAWIVPPSPEKHGLAYVAKLLPEPDPATRSWWAWFSELVTENQSEVPWTVIVARSSTPPDTPGTVNADHWSEPTGERSRTTPEQLPCWHEPTRARA